MQIYHNSSVLYHCKAEHNIHVTYSGHTQKKPVLCEKSYSIISRLHQTEAGSSALKRTLQSSDPSNPLAFPLRENHQVVLVLNGQRKEDKIRFN